MLGKKKEEGITEVKSILAEGLKIEGNIISEGKIRIDGTVEGDVRGDFLIFGQTAVIKGNVKAKSVVVMGTVEGNIESEIVEIKSSSKIKGDILVKELSIEPGASIDSRIVSGDYTRSSGETTE